MSDSLPTFARSSEALAALLWLWRGGVSAWVNRIEERAPVMPGLMLFRLPTPSFRICVTQADQARAIHLLGEFNEDQDDASAGMAREEPPDFSRISPTLAPPCPRCNQILPMSATISNCPDCLAPVDVADLIVQIHGPEAIADGYEQTPILDEASALYAPTPCRKCGYVLNGLGRVGLCPECGSPFDKDEAVRAWFA